MKNYFCIKNYSKKTAMLILLILASSCINKVEVDIKRNEVLPSKLKNVSVSNIQFINNQIVVSGSNLDSVEKLNIKVDNSVTALDIDSKSANSLVANTLTNVTFIAEKTLDLVLSNAHGATSFTVNFSLCDSLLGGKKISCTPPNDNDVLSFNAVLNKWVPKSVSGLNYQGVWDATDTFPVGIAPGDYYIVNVASPPYQVGDWIVFNGMSFDKIENSQAVNSVFGRTGSVIATEGDYDLNKLADVNLSVAPVLNQVLKYNGSQWVAGTVSLTETDPNVSAFAKASLPNCGIGQVLSSNGSSFSCVNDASGGGAYTGTMNRLVVTDGATGALSTLSVTTTEANYLSGVTSAIQTQLNAKLNSSSFVDWSGSSGVQTIDPSRLNLGVGNAGKVVVTNASGFVVSATATNTEIDYLSGVTSSIQTQLNNKLSSESDPNVSAFAKAALPNCSAGQVLSSNGTSFSCVTDNSGAGSFTGTQNRVVLTDGSTGALTTSSVTNTELGYLSGVTSSIQTQLNAKLSSFTETDPNVSAFAKTSLPTCGAGQVLSSNGSTLGCVIDDFGDGPFIGTQNRVVLTDGSTGALTTSSVSSTEIGYLSGVTSAIQTQINSKQSTITSSTDIVAGSLETRLQAGVSIKPYNAGTGQTGEFHFYELTANGPNYTGFKSPDLLGGNIIYTLPGISPTNGQVMSSTAAGVLSWIDIPSAPVSSVNTKTGAVVLTTSDVSEGSNLYHTGARVLSTVLTSLSTATNAVITATDSVLIAMGKLQAQISTHGTSISNKADVTNLSQSITAGNVNVTTINAAPVPDLSKMVANEGGATSVQIGSLAGRPVAAAGNTGRMYVVNDSGNEAIYVSTGSAWIKVASNGVSATVSVADGGTGATSFSANKAVVVNGAGSALIDGPSIDDTTALAATLVKRGPAGEVVGQYITPTTTVTENATCTVAIGTIAKDVNGNLLTCQ